MEVISYEPSTGIFLWENNKKCSGPVKVGEVAGSIDFHGYRIIQIDGAKYRAARLAVLYMTGSFPELVDHINRERSDDRWCNLRACNISENNRNISMKSNNTSGVKGISFHKASGKWVASIRVNKKQLHLGLYSDIELASLVVSEARIKYHGEFAA